MILLFSRVNFFKFVFILKSWFNFFNVVVVLVEFLVKLVEIGIFLLIEIVIFCFSWYCLINSCVVWYVRFLWLEGI